MDTVLEFVAAILALVVVVEAVVCRCRQVSVAITVSSMVVGGQASKPANTEIGDLRSEFSH